MVSTPIFLFCKHLFIVYLLAASDLQQLWACLAALWHVGSSFSDQGSNLYHLHWKALGNFLYTCFNLSGGKLP